VPDKITSCFECFGGWTHESGYEDICRNCHPWIDEGPKTQPTKLQILLYRISLALPVFITMQDVIGLNVTRDITKRLLKDVRKELVNFETS